MINFLANSFRQIITIATFLIFAVIVLSGLIAIIQGQIWFGLVILVVGTLSLVSIFGALAVILAQYEEIKEIKTLLRDRSQM